MVNNDESVCVACVYALGHTKNIMQVLFFLFESTIGRQKHAFIAAFNMYKRNTRISVMYK